MRMILFTSFDHLKEIIFAKEVQFKTFCLPVRTSCLTAETLHETPNRKFGTEKCLICQGFTVREFLLFKLSLTFGNLFSSGSRRTSAAAAAISR